MRLTPRHAMLSCLLLLAGCGGMDSVKVWPFGEKSGGGQVHAPENATLYTCAGGKSFYVRMLDNGATAWLIYPNREVGLRRSGDSGARYGNGIATLDLSGAEGTLSDGPGINYTGCKAAGAK